MVSKLSVSDIKHKLPNRIQNILEIVQYFVIYFILAFFGGNLLDLIFPDYDETKKSYIIFIEICTQVIVGMFIIYIFEYLQKYIPFLFKFTNDYTPGQHNESAKASSKALGLVFMFVQTNLYSKLTLLRNRWFISISNNNNISGSK